MEQQEIRAICDRLVNAVNPLQIFLFGSFAKGTQTADSDYDFYIVMPDNAGDRFDLSQAAYFALRNMKRRPVDIVVGHVSSFEERSKRNTLERIVLKEGVLLYG